MSIDDFAWTDKRLRPCPFCAKRNTYCKVDLLERVHDTEGNPYHDAVITCHTCGSTVHAMDTNRDRAIEMATDKWQHRAGDDE